MRSPSRATGHVTTVAGGAADGRYGAGMDSDVISGTGLESALGALGARMGIAITEAAPERAAGTMPVQGNTQPLGLLHGGASCVLAETLGSLAAALHAARYDGASVVGVDINATHHKAVRSGTVTGVASALRLGSSVCSYEVVITDETGERVCTARLTCLVRRQV